MGAFSQHSNRNGRSLRTGHILGIGCIVFLSDDSCAVCSPGLKPWQEAIYTGQRGSSSFRCAAAVQVCCLNHAWGEAFGPKWRPFPVATWRAAHPSECLPNRGCVDVRAHFSLSPPPASTGLTSSYHSGQAGIPRSPLLCLLGGIRGDNLILACNHKVNVQWPSGDLRITPRPASYLVLVMILFLAEPPRW